MDEEQRSGEMAQDAAPADKLAVRREIRREIGEFVKLILWFLILFFVIKTYVIEGYEVQGPSMIPTLHDRERILVFKLPQTLSQFRLFSGIAAIKQGDIVVFDSPDDDHDKRYVKRVIAKGPRRQPGKTVEAEKQDSSARASSGVTVCFNRGTVYVNNKRITEDYITPEEKVTTDSFPAMAVPPGRYYVLGDNRSVSKDSRSFGCIDDDRVVGKALFCFWPPSKIRLLR